MSTERTTSVKRALTRTMASARSWTHTRARSRSSKASKDQLQHSVKYSSCRLPWYLTSRRRVHWSLSRTPAYIGTTTARSYKNIDDAIASEKNNEDARTLATPRTARSCPRTIARVSKETPNTSRTTRWPRDEHRSNKAQKQNRNI
jgi:hypothetical protein